MAEAGTPARTRVMIVSWRVCCAAYAGLLPDERFVPSCAFMARALTFFSVLGVAVERVMADNGSA